MLIAGPGYGKTTLLEQWAAQEGRVVGWYRARYASADVAVLARGIVDSLSEVSPGVGRRLVERLLVSGDPNGEAELLAEMLLDDLVAWPAGAHLIIDDYQYIAESASSEAFVGTIVSGSAVEFVVAGRIRPSWVARRSILYGDVLEISQAALAMTSEESAQVLADGRPEMASGLAALADGWPAVIGLAAMTPDVNEIDADLPETLYEFFAEEVYRGLDPPIASGLRLLAALPVVDREIAQAVLGSELSVRVCDDGLALGIVDRRGDRLEFHPLAVAFLEKHVGDEGLEELAQASRLALAAYEARRDWDGCFALVRARGFDDDIVRLLELCLDELLVESRLVTLGRWLTHAEARGVHAPIVGVAAAEIDLRHGRHLSALTIARSLVNSEPGGTGQSDGRVWALAARAAHAGSLEEEALVYYERLQRDSVEEHVQREARWGRLMCLAALEQNEAHELLHELEASACLGDARDQVRMADKRLSLGFRFGFINQLAEARRVAALVQQIPDPIVRCSFRSMFAWALVLSSYYDEALAQATLLFDDATEYRVDLALSYGHATAGAALAGLRRFDEAADRLRQGCNEAKRTHDENGEQNVYSIRMRLLVQAGEVAEACASEPPDLSRALKSMRGEVLSSRALALATIGRLAEAKTLAAEAVAQTNGVEANQLAAVTLAVCAVKARDPEQRELSDMLVSKAFQSGAVDPVVSGYRANLDLLSSLLARPASRERTVFLLRRAGDEHLAGEIGATSTELVDPIANLSLREREIHSLICQGLSNRQIAKLLFISEATVKVHVQHVFDKTGIRSRTALALNAARRA